MASPGVSGNERRRVDRLHSAYPKRRGASRRMPVTFASAPIGYGPSDDSGGGRERMKVSDIVALPLQLGSAVRRRRVFHPVGVLAEGRLQRIAPPGEGLPIESADVLARVSKAIGVPGGLPDLVGLAWRMPPRESATTPWDVLMVSAGSGLLTRFALRPITSFTGTTFSTLMPLHRTDGWWW